MEKIMIPDSVTLVAEDGNEATFEVSPYFPGYGPTLGNALRRVLLSSLPGAAVTSVRFEGIDHEFSTIPGVKEDVVSILLNVKQLRLNVHTESPVELVLKVTGEKVVTAADFEKHADVEIVNPDLTIATLTDPKAELSLRLTATRGRGYIPVEEREEEDRDIGEIAIDSVFTPVERVSFRVENVRVGRETEHHKLLITIRTDGTIAPRDALSQAASILEDHFRALVEGVAERLTERRAAEAEAPEAVTPAVSVAPRAEEEPVGERRPEPEEHLVREDVHGAVRAPEEREPESKSLPIVQFPVSTRIQNILEREGIRTVAGLIQKTREQLLTVDGLGDKAVEEVERALGDLRLTLRQERRDDA